MYVIKLKNNEMKTKEDKVSMVYQLLYGKLDYNWDEVAKERTKKKSIVEKCLLSYFGKTKTNETLDSFYSSEMNFVLGEKNNEVFIILETLPAFINELISFSSKVIPMVEFELIEGDCGFTYIDFLCFDYASVIYEQYASITRSLENDLSWEEVEVLNEVRKSMSAEYTHCFYVFECDTCKEYDSSKPWHVEFMREELL